MDTFPISNSTSVSHTSSSTSTSPQQQQQDRSIMATSADAILAKQATVQAGYYKDPFIDAFAPSSGSGGRSQRYIQPIIKRGTHARVCCMDRVLASFLDQHQHSTKPPQVCVLGAGKDTSYFRYRAGRLLYKKSNASMQQQPAPVHWYEVDHASIVQDKAKAIQKSKLLQQVCPHFRKSSIATQGYISTDCDEGTMSPSSSSIYRLVPYDLRHDPQPLLDTLLSSLDPSVPTLFLLECVFMYMPVSASTRLLQALQQRHRQQTNDICAPSWIALYEPMLQDDPFGRVMEQNLIRAGLASRQQNTSNKKKNDTDMDTTDENNNEEEEDGCGLLRIRTISQHLERLIDQGGWDRAVGCDMWSAYESILTEEQRRIANKAEFLDEIEEWKLIMNHYCLIVGVVMGSEKRTTVSSEEDEMTESDCLTQTGPDSPIGFQTSKSVVLEKKQA